MINRKIRLITDEERAVLENLHASEFYEPFIKIRNPADVVGIVFLILLFAALGFIMGTFAALFVFVLSRIVPALAPLTKPAAVRCFLYGGAFASAAGIPFWLWLRRRSFSAARKHLIEKDLREARVEVLHVTASAAARCEAVEYGGELSPAFFIETGPSTLLFLQGKYLAPAFDSGTFPSTDFIVVRTLHSGLALELVCNGPPLSVSPVDYGDMAEEETCFPSDGEIVAGSLNSLKRDLQGIFKKNL